MKEHMLDSRMLGQVNTFIQKVTEPGDLVIDLRDAVAGFVPLNEDAPMKMKVKASRKSAAELRNGGKQHDLPIRFDKGKFEATEPPQGVEQGDVLVFHPADRGQRHFAVSGRVGERSFSSTELVDQAVYTHAFGRAGTYRWADANGSKVGGEIVVRDDPATGKQGAERAIERMAEGAVVHIVGDDVTPRKLEITTGQTVFFAVEKTKGITITDVRLLEKGGKRAE